MPETLARCLFITLLGYFNFLTQFIEWQAILFFVCVIIKLTCVTNSPSHISLPSFNAPRCKLAKIAIFMYLM